MSVNWTTINSWQRTARGAGCFLILLASFSLVFAASDSGKGSGGEDYYRRDEKLWSEFREKRRIFVSAKDDSTRTVFLGAGLVNQAVVPVWCWATQAEKIRMAAPNLENFKWDLVTGALSFDFSLLWMKYHIQGQALPRYSLADATSRRIVVSINSGTWIPVTGELAFLPGGLQAVGREGDGLRADQTWIRLSGQTAEGKTLSFPLRWALEAFMQRLAGRLREKIESDPQPVMDCPGGRL